MPNMEEFLNRLREQGVEIKETGSIVFGPRGSVKFRYAERPGYERGLDNRWACGLAS